MRTLTAHDESILDGAVELVRAADAADREAFKNALRNLSFALSRAGYHPGLNADTRRATGGTRAKPMPDAFNHSKAMAAGDDLWAKMGFLDPPEPETSESV